MSGFIRSFFLKRLFGGRKVMQDTNYIWIVVAILLVWNLFAFLLMGLDKLKAKKEVRRISESTLLLIAFALGGIGSLLGMIVWHHKTKKPLFLIGVPVAIAVNALTIYGATLLFW